MASDVHTSEPSRPAIREALIGSLCALFMVVGRWGPTRLLGGDPSVFLEVRFWVASAVIGLSLLPWPAAHARRIPYAGSWSLSLVALCTWLLCSVGWAPDTELGAAKGAEILTASAMVLCMLRAARWGSIETLQRTFSLSLFVLLSFLAFVALLGTLGGGRAGVLGGGPNVFGRNMGLLAVLALDRAYRAKAMRWAALAALAFALVSLSGSRGALLASAIGVLAGLWASPQRPSRRFAVAIVGLLAMVAVLTLSPVGARALESFQLRFVKLLVEDRYFSGRDLIADQAFSMIPEAPVVGHGLAAFKALTIWPYPHNIGLEFLIEGGLIALGLAGMLLLAWWASWRQGRRDQHFQAAGFGALVLTFAAAQFSGDLFDSRGILVFMVFTTFWSRR